MPIDTGAGATDQTRDTSLNTPPQASPSTLAGDDAQAPAQAQPQQPNSDEGLKMAVQQVRQMQVGMMDMARQFPAAASALRQAADGLRAALRQIIANPGSPEPPAPNIGG